ncbi:MAG: VWA domain-containing protein [archaeon]|nr:VWA domain-containing protein [archaeon]
MSGRSLSYPFTAVIGENTAKRALQCLLADDSLNGVLIKGPSGTAKSVLVRALAGLTDRKIIDLPAGAGDEDIFGGIDFEAAVRDGKTVLKGGILQRADGNVLCIDNINLLDPRTLNTVTECISTETVKIEREGISAEYHCKTTVVATMDPAERDLPESIADRFDICVLILPDENVVSRADVISQDLEYRADPEAFCARFKDSDREIREKIEAARQKIPSIKITRRDINDIVIICNKVNAVGHRGDIACARVARALAALDGSDYIRADDIKEASVMCLVHRRKPKSIVAGEADAYVQGNSETRVEKNDDSEPEISNREIAELARMARNKEMDDAEMQAILDSVEAIDPDKTTLSEAPKEIEVLETDEEENVSGEAMDIPDIDVITSMLDDVKTDLANIDRIEAIHLNKVVGQIPRAAKSGDRNGRACGYTVPEGKSTDPALGATIRAAAPYQKMRKPNGLSIVIEPSDIRENIRTKASSCSFMFGLDVSGSLKDTGRLDEAIAAVRAMLEDGYVRRDRVGLLTFGQLKVNLAVPFTRNVEAVFDAIEKTETGGSTPLGRALLTLNKYMNNYVRKNPDEQCYIILVTDGEADTAVTKGYEPKMELRRICATIKIPNTEWIIIDNGSRSRRVNYALKLANYLGGRCIDIRELV